MNRFYTPYLRPHCSPLSHLTHLFLKSYHSALIVMEIDICVYLLMQSIKLLILKFISKIIHTFLIYFWSIMYVSELVTCSVCKFINVISPVLHIIDCVFYYTMATYTLNIQYNVWLVYNVCMYETLLHTLCC